MEHQELDGVQFYFLFSFVILILDAKSKKINKCILKTMHNLEREHKNNSSERVFLALHPFASRIVPVAYNIELFATLSANFMYGIFCRIEFVTK
jgi:hypothetical protein